MFTRNTIEVVVHEYNGVLTDWCEYIAMSIYKNLNKIFIALKKYSIAIKKGMYWLKTNVHLSFGTVK